MKIIILSSIFLLLLTCVLTQSDETERDINSWYVDDSYDTVSTMRDIFTRYPLTYAPRSGFLGVESIVMLDLQNVFEVRGTNFFDSNIPSTYSTRVGVIDGDFAYLAFDVGLQGAIGKFQLDNGERITTSLEIEGDDLANETVIEVNVTRIEVIPYMTSIATIPVVQQMSGVKVDTLGNYVYYVSSTSPPTVYKVLTDDMTVDSTLTLENVTGFLFDMHIDPQDQYLYLILTIGSFNQLYRLDLGDFSTIDTLDLGNETGSNLLASVYDSLNKRMVFASENAPGSTESLLYTVNLSGDSMVISNVTVSIQAFSPRSAVMDEIHGFAYFVSFGMPSRITRFNMLDLIVVDQFPLESGQGRSTGVSIDVENRILSIIAISKVIKVIVPSPCLSDCLGRGTCGFGGVCTCEDGWFGADCSQIQCAKDTSGNMCSNQGFCVNQTCNCFPGWTGDICDIEHCPLSCSGNGVCDEDTLICECDSVLFTGDGCEIQLDYIACADANGCLECTTNPSCVWCEGQCVGGSLAGPDEGYCPVFHHQSCPPLYLLIINLVFIVITALLFLNNMYSAFSEDREAEADTKKSWWRSQRSGRIWLIFERWQMIVLVILLPINVPTNFIYFARTFYWTLMSTGIGSVRVYDTAVGFATRSLLSVEQHLVTTSANAGDWMIGVSIVIAALLVVGLISIIVCRVVGSFNNNRGIYVALRLVYFMQIGGIAISMCALLNSGNLLSVIFAIVVLVVFFGFTIFSTAILYKMKKGDLFKKENRKKFGFLWEQYKHTHSWFGIINIWRRALIGLILGIFSSSSESIFIIPLIFAISFDGIYLIAFLVIDPFLDVTTKITEIFAVVADITLFALAFTFTDPSLAWLVNIIASTQYLAWIAAIITYFIQWMRMMEYDSFAQIITGNE